jgi:hypothetical protein
MASDVGGALSLLLGLCGITVLETVVLSIDMAVEFVKKQAKRRRPGGGGNNNGGFKHATCEQPHVKPCASCAAMSLIDADVIRNH